MEEVNDILSEENGSLKCSLYSHFILFLVTIGLNIICFLKMYFLNKIYFALFIICAIIFIILFTVPIHPLILICKKKFRNNDIKMWKKLSLAIIFIVAFFGILINLVICLNIYGLFSFYKECPYNFSYNDIVDIFNINYNNYINNITYSDSSKCSDNRCILIQEKSENPLPFSYLCNFDSSYDYESLEKKIAKTFLFAKINKDNDTKINCEKVNENDFYNNEIFIPQSNENFYILKSYYDICSSENSFYICDRNEKPKEFDISKDFSCPKVSDNIIDVIIAILLFVFNFFLPFFLSIVEFCKYKKILELYEINVVESISTQSNTKKASQQRSSNNENNNGNNNNEIPSQTLIVPASSSKNSEENLINVYNNENLTNNEGVLIISKVNKEDIHDEIQENNNINSDRNKIRINNLIKNETGEIYNNTNNSIDFRKINFNKTNDKDKDENEIYSIKHK